MTLKYPLSDSSFLLPNFHGLSPINLLSTIHTVLAGFFPIADPQWEIGAYCFFLRLIMSSASLYLASSFVLVLIHQLFLLYFFFHLFLPVNIFSFSFLSFSVSFLFDVGVRSLLPMLLFLVVLFIYC